MNQHLLDTPVGRARLDYFPAHGFTVTLVTQPYRVQDNQLVADPASLDQAWTTVWAHLAATTPPGPTITGGRSAGSRSRRSRTRSSPGLKTIPGITKRPETGTR